VHVEIKFPEVASHIEGEQFRMKLFEVVGEAEMMEVFIGPGTTYRKSYELVPSTPPPTQTSSTNSAFPTTATEPSRTYRPST
jgi:hypothetical protein